jgi:hypothetical protein
MNGGQYRRRANQTKESYGQTACDSKSDNDYIFVDLQAHSATRDHVWMRWVSVVLALE